MDRSTYLTAAAALASVPLLGLLWSHFNRPSYPLPPGPKPDFLVGNLRNFPKTQWYSTWTSWQQKYGDISYARVFGKSYVIINNLEDAKELLVKRGNIYSGRSRSILVCVVMGRDWNFVESEPGPYHSECRTIFRKAIGPQEVATYDGLIEEHARLLIDAVQGFQGDPWPLIHSSLAAIIIKIAYGESLYREHSKELIRQQGEMQHFIASNVMKFWLVDFIPWLHYLPDWLPLPFKKYGKKGNVMQKRMHYWAWDETKKLFDAGIADPCIAVEYMEKDENMSVARDAVAMMYSAGVDNTGSAISIFLSNILLHPEVQRRIQVELDQELGGAVPIYNDRPRLRYLDAAWRESQRLYSSNPLGVPHKASQEDVYKGMYIPKGAVLVANLGFMCRDPRIFQNPASFDPERWLPEYNPSASSLPNVEDILFGFGRRICPGRFLSDRTAFTVIATILKMYEIVPVPGESVPERYEYPDGVFSRPLNFRCKFVSRTKT